MAASVTSPWLTNVQGNDFVQTAEVGGSRFGMWASSAFNPVGMVGSSTVTQLSYPTVPPLVTQTSSASMGDVAAGTSPAATAASAPFSPTKSPLVWVILALVVSVLLVHKLYYKKGK